MYRETGLVCDQDDGAHAPNVLGVDTLPNGGPRALMGVYIPVMEPAECRP